MNKRTISVSILIFVMIFITTLFLFLIGFKTQLNEINTHLIHVKANEYEKKVEQPIIEEVEEVVEKSETIAYNILCETNKYVSLTNIDTVIIDWQWIDLDYNGFYVENGVVKENGTGAIAAAMGNNYKKGSYYNVTMSNGTNYLVKMVDTKQNIHTDDNNCYTKSDNSIVEIWVTNNFDYLNMGISKHTEFGEIIRIEDV